MTLPPDLLDAGITLHALDVRTADDAALTALAAHEQAMEQESTPEDPPTPVEERIAGWRNSPDFAEIACWVARDAAGEIIADVWVEIWHTGSNEHAVWFNIQVLPDYRRRGLGRALLAAGGALHRIEGPHAAHHRYHGSRPRRRGLHAPSRCQTGSPVEAAATRARSRGPRSDAQVAGAGRAQRRAIRVRLLGWPLPRRRPGRHSRLAQRHLEHRTARRPGAGR